MISKNLRGARGSASRKSESGEIAKRLLGDRLDLRAGSGSDLEDSAEFSLSVFEKASLTMGVFMSKNEAQQVFCEIFLCVYFLVHFKREFGSNFSEMVKFRVQVMEGRLEAEVDCLRVNNERLKEIFRIPGRNGLFFEKMLAFCLHVSLQLGFVSLPGHLGHIKVNQVDRQYGDVR